MSNQLTVFDRFTVVEFDENQVDFPKNIENNINNLYLIIMLFGIINLFLIFAVCKKGKYQEKVIELTNNVDKAKNKLDNITYEIKKVKKEKRIYDDMSRSFRDEIKQSRTKCSNLENKLSKKIYDVDREIRGLKTNILFDLINNGLFCK